MKENFPDARYLELAEKWLNGTISKEEEKEYADWYNSLSPDEVLEIPANSAVNKEAHRLKLLQKINSKRKARILSLTPKNFYRIAAAVLILLAGGAYLYMRNINSVDSLALKDAKRKSVDIKGGTTGAILTLANGKTIVLDTAGNGRLVSGDNAEITKSDGSVAITASATESSQPLEYNLLATPRARQQQLVLSDGTRLWLNAESSIKFPSVFARHQREVEVTGEVYFEVAKDPSRPFVVKVNDASVEVLGTHFNVMAYKNEPALETTLLEGSVRFRKGEKIAVLKPGQQSRLLSNEEIKLVPDADVDAVVAWKNGVQVFDGADLRTIMRQVERWYDVDVEFKGIVPSRTFSGDIPRTANLSEVLQLLEAVGKIHFSLDASKKKLIVMS